jgi:hypothetical protein
MPPKPKHPTVRNAYNSQVYPVLRRLLFCLEMNLVRTGVLDNNDKPFNTLFNRFSASRRDLYGDNEICKLL